MPNDAMRIEPERIDDLPLVLGLLQRLGIGEVLDRHLGSGHGNRKGLSYGQLALGLCARIISTQDHRLVSVEAWAQRHQALLTRCLGTAVADQDFSDDRLADLLYALGHDAAVREAIETELAQQMVRAYRLPTEVGRADSTSVSVYHERAADSEGLVQFGHSKDHRPDLR
jgi:transposase